MLEMLDFWVKEFSEGWLPFSSKLSVKLRQSLNAEMF